MDTILSNNIPIDSKHTKFDTSLLSNTNILDLHSSNCIITSDDIQNIIDYLHNNTNLTTFVFGRNGMTLNMMVTILKRLDSMSLTTLIFNGTRNKIREYSSINIIDVSIYGAVIDTTIGKSIRNIFIDIIKYSTTLTTLRIIDDNICRHYTDGILSMGPLIRTLEHNSILTTLQLSNINMGDSEIDILSDILNSTTIEELDLNSNNICHGIIKLAMVLKTNTTIKILNLSYNYRLQMYSHEVRIFRDVLSTNMTLTQLDLSNNNISIRDKEHILTGLDYNNTLVSLKFHDDDNIIKRLHRLSPMRHVLMELKKNNYTIRELTLNIYTSKLYSMLRRNNYIYQQTFWSKSIHHTVSPEMHSLAISLYLMNGEFTVVLPYMVLNYILEFIQPYKN